MGNSLDLRKVALELDKATEQILESVMARTRKSESEVRSWFDPKADKFFSAGEAVKVKLADGFSELPTPNPSTPDQLLSARDCRPIKFKSNYFY